MRAGPAAPAVSGLLDEHEGKTLLAAWGVPVTVDRLLPAAPLGAADAEGLPYPLALKIVSRDIPHKSEVGGVELAIPDAPALRTAVSSMLARVAARVPGARLEGLLASQMVTDGIETIVGVVDALEVAP
jgi:acyl-CoA synthetase (NDP forming)